MIFRFIKRKTVILSLITLFNIYFFNALAKEHLNDDFIPTYKIIFIKDLLPQVNINDAYAALKVWVSELCKVSRNKFEAVPEIIDNIEDIPNLPDKGNILLINMNIKDFVEYREKLKLEGAYLPANNGNIYNNYILLTRNEDNNITKLKGKILGLQITPLAEIQNEWLDVFLNNSRYGLKEKFFKNIKRFDNDSQLILGVFFGKIDACVTSKSAYDLMCELNPQIAKKLSIIADSPGLLNSISCFTNDFINPEHRKFAIENAQRLISYPGGKQIMTLTNTQQIILYKEEYLENTIKILSKYKSIRGKAGK